MRTRLVKSNSEMAVTKRIVVLALVLVLVASTAGGAYYFSSLPNEPSTDDGSLNPNPSPLPEVTPEPSTATQEKTPNLAKPQDILPGTPQPQPQPTPVVEEKVTFLKTANATLGNWSATVEYTPKGWEASVQVKMNVSLSFSNELFSAFKPPLIQNVSQVSILVTTERDFDPYGYQHTP